MINYLAIGVNIPTTLAVLIDFVLLVLIIDGFISLDPSYEIVNKLIFAVPMSIYLINKTWEDLLISKIPMNNWVNDEIFRQN